MSLFVHWIDLKTEKNGSKILHTCTEKKDGRAKITKNLKEVICSHYNDLSIITADIKDLGYDLASKILKERLPEGKKARSGDLGEILGTEYIENYLHYQIPIRRLRYKDGREMALRGDDFIGIKYDSKNGLHLLKGESKSAKFLSTTIITKARTALNRDHGRCTPHSLLFIADRLLENGLAPDALGRALKTEVGTKSMKPSKIAHAFFTLSGNSPLISLRNDLNKADPTRVQITINLQISDHQEFIAEFYKDLHKFGNS